MKIVDFRVAEYIMPLPKGFSTSRGSVNRSTNCIFELFGETKSGKVWHGIGEAAPRRISGDNIEKAYDFLYSVGNSLKGQEFQSNSTENSIISLKEFLIGLNKYAKNWDKDFSHMKPFRGCISGIEMTLLDILSKQFEMTVSQMLGEFRQDITISASTHSAKKSRSRLKSQIKQQASKFPAIRVKGSGDPEADLDLLRFATKVNSKGKNSTILWIDVNQGYSEDEARIFIEKVYLDQVNGNLPKKVLVEQPTAKFSKSCLSQLQSYAEHLSKENKYRNKIAIMADESVWDIDDLRELHDTGGCDGVNIKIQKSGGILAGLEVAKAALSFNRKSLIYVGGMLGTSDITRWALLNFGKSLPKLDFITSGPTTNLEAQVALNRVRYLDLSTNKRKKTGPIVLRKTIRKISRILPTEISFLEALNTHIEKRHFPKNLISNQSSNGIGTEVDYKTLEPYVRRHHGFEKDLTLPENEILFNSQQDEFERLGKIAIDSYLLESEALAHGYNTIRYSDRVFVAKKEDHTIPFYWTGGPKTFRFHTAACGNKQMTRAILEHHGAKIPKGRRFNQSEIEDALKWARQIGWPVVVKPFDGTGGKGVTTNIQNEADLISSISSLPNKADYVVEKHLQGTDYRILVLNNEVVSVVKRVNAHIKGDGVNSIEQLIALKNKARKENPHLPPIKINKSLQIHLKRLGYDLSTIPDSNELVILKSAANISQGGESFQCLHDLHPSIKKVAIEAVNAIPQLVFCGVDIILEDHRKPVSEQSVGICELNSHPAITSAHFPMNGNPINVAEKIFQFYAKNLGLESKKLASQVRITISGHVQGVGYRRWMQQVASNLGLNGEIWNTPNNQVVAEISGKTNAIALLSSRCIVGPRRSKPQSLFVEHIENTTDLSGITIRT